MLRDKNFYEKYFHLLLKDEQLKQMDVFREFLLEKNKQINLTSITEYEEMRVKHFIDSLSLMPVIDELFTGKDKGLNIIDVGSGAGFPGIPLKIALPGHDMILLDSVRKKTDFLNEAIERLELQNIRAIHSRAETEGQNKEMREFFDLAVARAVASLPQLCELCLPFVKTGGYFIAMKANISGDELQNGRYAAGVLGGEIRDIKEFYLPETDIFRTLVVFRKIKPTPGAYPRRAGLPASKPLHPGL